MQFDRLLGIAFSTHLGGVEVDVQTQGAVLFVKLVAVEDLVHRCSPSRPVFQKNIAQNYAGNIRAELLPASPKATSPGIVRNPA